MKGYKYYYKKKNMKLRYFLLGIAILFVLYLIIKSVPHMPFMNTHKEKYLSIEKMIQQYDTQQDRLKKKVILSKIDRTINKLLNDEALSEDGALAYLAGSVNFRKGLLQHNKDLRNRFLDKAIYYYRRSLALLKESDIQGRLHYELGKSYFYKGDYYYYESLLELEKAKKCGYKNKNIDKIITIIKLKKGELSNISYLINYFKNSKAGEVESLFYDALTYKNNKDYKKAKETFLKAEEYFSKKVVETEEKKYIIFKTLYSLAWLYYNEGNHDRSEEYYNKALKWEENNADIYYWLAKIYQAKKKRRKAIKMLKKALNINPDHKFAKMKLKKLRRGR